MNLPNIVVPKSVDGVEYTYELTPCNGRCDTYCRCTQIVGARVVKIDSWRALVEEFFPKIKNEIDFYIADRLLRRLLDEDDFEVDICGGYYGEEVNGVRYCGSNRQIFDDFNKLTTRTERLRFTLRQEYGYLLPEIEQVDEWEVREVEVDSIRAFEGHMRHVDTKAVSKYREDPPDIACLCIPCGDEQYRLIDGRHRFTAICASGEKKVKILVPKNFVIQKDSEDQIRRNALAKLSDEEKRVLGLM